MTTAYPDERDGVVAAEGVYAPQEDSRLLLDVMEKTGLAIGRRVADLCTGSGFVAQTMDPVWAGERRIEEGIQMLADQWAADLAAG